MDLYKKRLFCTDRIRFPKPTGEGASQNGRPPSIRVRESGPAQAGDPPPPATLKRPRAGTLTADGGRRVRVAALGKNAGYFWVRALQPFRLEGLPLRKGAEFVWWEDLITLAPMRLKDKRQKKATPPARTRKPARKKAAPARKKTAKAPKKATPRQRRQVSRRPRRVALVAKARTRPRAARRPKAAPPPPPAAGPAPRVCAWCQVPLTTIRGRFCSRKHRQSAFRLRLKGGLKAVGPQIPSSKLRPRRFAFADLSEDTETAASITKGLRALQRFAGWGLAVSPEGLRRLLPQLGRQRFRLCAWVDDGSQFPPPATGFKSGWTAVIVSTPAPLPGTLDAIAVPDEDGHHRAMLTFATWLFAALGMRPGDDLIELPDQGGTGDVVANAWAELARHTPYTPRRRRRRRTPQTTVTTVTEDGHKHPVDEPPEPPAEPGPVADPLAWT